jgi:hypothetical protein
MSEMKIKRDSLCFPWGLKFHTAGTLHSLYTVGLNISDLNPKREIHVVLRRWEMIRMGFWLVWRGLVA